jgi:hypothetical protein
MEMWKCHNETPHRALKQKCLFSKMKDREGKNGTC